MLNRLRLGVRAFRATGGRPKPGIVNALRRTANRVGRAARAIVTKKEGSP